MQRIYQPPPEVELRPGERLAVSADLFKKVVAREGVQAIDEIISGRGERGKPRP